MTKQEIDIYFTENHEEIMNDIKIHSNTCISSNDISIFSDVYLLSVQKRKDIKKGKLKNFIKKSTLNIYRWPNSQFNRENKVISNNISISNIYTEESDEMSKEMKLQSMEFALEAYYHNAEPHERIFFDAYVNKGIRTVRAIRDHFGVSHRGSQKLIKEFKQKVKYYERKE